MRIIVILLGLLLCLSDVVFAKDFSKQYEALDKSVVIIYSDSEQVRTNAQETTSMTSSSLGTGTLINDEGLILTAAHVVNNADSLTIDVKGRGIYKAKVLSSYQPADIAIIKLITNEKGFSFATLGDSKTAKVGNEVFVIGTPYGLSHTLTVGHLSGRRVHKGIIGEIEFLQTDAAINQGNSGGPLFNQQGQLIGVVSYIETQSGGNEGLGFAASSNMVKRILLEQPTIWFGLEYTVLTPQLATALNVPQGSGLLIEKVAKQSFSDAVGLKAGTIAAVVDGTELILGGDIVLAIGDYSITADPAGYANIINYLKAVKSDERITFRILRSGQIIELSARKPSTVIKLI